MEPSPMYQIYSRRQQGLTETARLILECTATPYGNVFVEDWEKEKDSTPLEQLPVLRVKDDMGKWHQISESHTIERYLSTTHGLLGTTALEAATLDMYHATWSDMHSMFMWRVWRASSPEAKISGAAEFWVEYAKFLKKHDEILQKKAEEGRGPFYGGSAPALPDVYAFTWLNRWITGWIPCPEGAITEEKYPFLWKLWKGVRESRGIKEYFDSGRWSLAE